MNNTYLSNICYKSPKLAVKDSFEDEEASDEVEDEVFIRDGKNGFKFDDEMGVKRPLMAPRRKLKYNHLHVEHCQKPFYKRIFVPYCCGVPFLALFLGIAIAMVTLITVFPFSFDKLKHWTLKKNKIQLNIVPCTEFVQAEVWHQTFPKLKSEAALTSFDSNHDDYLDIVVGFATGVKEEEMPGKCEAGTERCGGGVLVLDGRSGALLWKHWTRRDVLFIDCTANVNADQTKDCLISGKGGVLCVVDGGSGSLIWELSKGTIPYLLDLYSAQYVTDLNNDGLAEVLISHTSDSSGHLVILNGRDGQMLGQVEAPDKQSVFMVPRVTLSPDGSFLVLFATGTLDSGGSLYLVPLFGVFQSDSSKMAKLWSSPTSGISSSLVLVDMNGDLLEDVILTTGDRLVILSGRDFSVIRNITSILPNSPSQILTGPTPGYFDDDEIPDLMITQLIGPSFPTYYFSESWMASGKQGDNLLDEPILGSGDVTAPGISVGFTGTGNDMYLYWRTTCNTYPQSQKQPFTFSQGTSIHDKTHANLCHLRFNTSQESQLYLLNQHLEPPGLLLYSSSGYPFIEDKWAVEHNETDGGGKMQQQHKVTTTSAEEFYSGQRQKQSQLQKGPHSLFRHKTNPLLEENTSYQYPPPQETGDERSSYNYPRYETGEARDQWDRPLSYSDSLPVLPEINLGALALDEDEAVYQNANNGAEPVDVDGRDERAEYGNRMKRSINGAEGPPLLHRAVSSATLVKSLDGGGVDIVFASHWEVPSPNVRILLEKDTQCIRRKMMAVQTANNLNALEMEMVEETAERECLGESRMGSFGKNSPRLGALTVYRLTFNCKCSPPLSKYDQCSRPLPIERQSYPRRASDVYFKTRQKDTYLDVTLDSTLQK